MAAIIAALNPARAQPRIGVVPHGRREQQGGRSEGPGGDRLGGAGIGPGPRRPARHPPPAARAARRNRRPRPRALGGHRPGVLRVAGGCAGRARSGEGERAALRSAGGVLRARARTASQVQRLPVERRRRLARRGRGGGAGRDLRPCRPRRRPERPRARLRLGLAHPVDGRALSGQPHHGAPELALAARVHRKRSGAARLGQRARRHLRHQRLRARRERAALRPHRLGRDVRAPAQLAGGVAPCRLLARARGALLHARVRASRRALCLRRSRRQRLDEPALLFGRHDAERRPGGALPGRSASAPALALERHALRSHRRGLARQHGCQPCRVDAALRIDLRPRRRGDLVDALASLLHVVRRAVRIRRRRLLVGLARPVRTPRGRPMSPLARAALGGLATAAALAGLTWLASLARRDVSLVDRMWSLMIALPLVAYAAVLRWTGPRPTVLAVLLALWAVRLAAYVSWRNWGHGEDRRYQEIRARNEPNFALKSLYLIFVLQALLAWLVSLPLLAVLAEPREWSLLDTIGAALA